MGPRRVGSVCSFVLCDESTLLSEEQQKKVTKTKILKTTLCDRNGGDILNLVRESCSPSSHHEAREALAGAASAPAAASGTGL